MGESGGRESGLLPSLAYQVLWCSLGWLGWLPYSAVPVGMGKGMGLSARVRVPSLFRHTQSGGRSTRRRRHLGATFGNGNGNGMSSVADEHPRACTRAHTWRERALSACAPAHSKSQTDSSTAGARSLDADGADAEVDGGDEEGEDGRGLVAPADAALRLCLAADTMPFARDFSLLLTLTLLVLVLVGGRSSVRLPLPLPSLDLDLELDLDGLELDEPRLPPLT